MLCKETSRGDHPRLRGEYLTDVFVKVTFPGSSPACAGNTKSDKYCQNLYWDHPRLCGEYSLSPSIWCVMLGSSSLVRGIRGRNGTKGLLDRIIPACAGNTSFKNISCNATQDHPRLCGEYSFLNCFFLCRLGSSPLVRGIHSKKLDFP